MAERLSTGFVNAIAATGSVKDVMANGVIHIYTGTQPTNADSAETGTLVMKITKDGGAFTPGVATNGLNMGTVTAGVLAKNSDTWKGTGLAAAGTGVNAGWFRWYANDVTTGASSTAVRVDGAIGTSSSYELQLTNIVIAENGEATISSFNYTIPQA